MAKGSSVFAASMLIEESLVNTGDPWPDLPEAEQRVLVMQTKLHQWAAADPGRCFDDLFTSCVTRRSSLWRGVGCGPTRVHELPVSTG